MEAWLSTVLDEAMSKAVAATGSEALTAELRFGFAATSPPVTSSSFAAGLSKRNRRLIEAEAVLTASDGTEHAHAWASFLTLPGAST